VPVIDVQVHPFDRNHPGRPWASPSHGLDSATGEEMVAAMNSVGVDGAIMVSSFSAYEYDPSYALEVYKAYPDKFRVVTPVDATDPAIDDVVANWAATPGARGIRIRMRDGLPMDADHPGLNRAFAAAARHGWPSICCAGASSTKVCRTSSAIAIRSSSSTISDFCSRPARRSPPTFGPIFQSCSPWLNMTTSG
jgi:predicted TIM-barrel fold metal-dependent hydrolase